MARLSAARGAGGRGLIWRAEVAEPQEMVPWIRGWGADVEVLAPERVRESLMSETARLADLYDIQPIPTWQHLWAKTSDDRTQTHPLICHMIDVAQVALTMWNDVLTAGIRAQFTEGLSLNQEAPATSSPSGPGSMTSVKPVLVSNGSTSRPRPR